MKSVFLHVFRLATGAAFMLLAANSLAAKTFTFQYAGSQRQFTWAIPQDDLAYYKSQSHTQGFGGKSYADYAKEEGDNLYISDLAAALKRSAEAEGFTEWQTVNYIVAFVQSLNYFNDPNPYQDYVRYPIETLNDDGGDCEDTAILLAVVLERLGYNTVLLNPPGHMATGLECSDCKGTKISYEGNDYSYIETTGSGFSIGQMAMNFTSFNVFELDHSGEGEAIASGGAPSGLSPGGGGNWQNSIIPGGKGGNIFGFENPIVIDWSNPHKITMPEMPGFRGHEGFTMPEMPGFRGHEGFTMPEFPDFPDIEGGNIKSTTTTQPDGSTVIIYTITMPATISRQEFRSSFFEERNVTIK